MTNGVFPTVDGTPGDAADHVAKARVRAREILSGEPHLGDVDDWRLALAGARDAMILLWIVWVGLQGFGNPAFAHWLVLAFAVSIALLTGISTGRATHTKIEYYAAELDRERGEIHDHLEHEKDEVRALYEAKGFREPLLGQIVETLAADDDRLLKVMMEEELGLSMSHMNHPLIVGLWNFGAALAGGLAIGLPLIWMSPRTAQYWVPIGGAALLAVLSVLVARHTRRSAIEFFGVGVMMATVTGGVSYWLCQWLGGLGAA